MIMISHHRENAQKLLDDDLTVAIEHMTITQETMPRRTVNVHEDEGIWILLDEGCNSNCHGKEWAKNAEKKLSKYGLEFKWMNRTTKHTKVLVQTKVRTYGKRCMPASIKLNNGKVIKCTLESHEQEGKHPVLLSKPSQAELGLVKNMRKNTCYLMDYGEEVEMCRAHDTGLDCICISNYTANQDRAITLRKAPKVVNRKLEEKNVVGKKLGVDESVDIELTAKVAIGLRTLRTRCGARTHPGSTNRIDQEIHMITQGLMYYQRR